MFLRKFAPKRKTGCLTCKIRRVKCDEGKPCCRRCISSGRKCDGYLTVVEWMNQPDRLHNSPKALITTHDAKVNHLERQAFDYFVHCTAPFLAGYFHDDAWNRAIPQLAQANPAVRHAINAVASIHRERWPRLDTEEVQEQKLLAFSTEQYMKALHHFRTLLGSDRPPTTLILTCSLLLIHFEALREDFVSAMLHIKRISMMLNMMNTSSHERVDSSIVEALRRIDIQTSVYLGSRAPDLAFLGPDQGILQLENIQNIVDARQVVTWWTCRMYHFLRATADHYKYSSPGNVPLEVIYESGKLERLFVGIDGMLSRLQKTCEPTDTYTDQRGLFVLVIRVKLNRILCIGCLYAEESMYDAYLDEFRNILDMCKVLNVMQVNEARITSVLLDEALLQPLTLIATLCRDGCIRHEALDELQKLAEYRRSWHVQAAWRMVEKRVCLEEDSSERDMECHDIPEWRRIHSHGFEMLQNFQSRNIRARFQYLPNGIDGGWNNYEEEISW